jgi:hypothetical protein
MGMSVAALGFIMSSRFHVAWLGGIFIVTIGQSVAVAQPHPHSQPPGRRVAPLPAGEGGSLYVQAPLQLCADNMYEFHLHQRTPERGEVLYVLEAPAGPSSCQWEIHDLAEGTYEVLIEAVSDGRIVARADGEVVKGTPVSLILQSVDLQIEGFLHSTGLPAKELSLRLAPSGGPTRASYHAMINEDGSYRVIVDRTDSYFIELSAKKEAGNHLLKYPLRFDSAVERLDLEIAPGVIQVVVPPFTSAPDSSWASVTLRPIKVQTVPDGVLSANGSSFGFKSKEGRRGNYIGLPYGEYEVFLTIDIDRDAAKVASARMTLSEGNEVASVTLSPVNTSN